mmetsp:Transcript_9189/g.12053  ORF Transcript_9189/g.12053 Transcript_9189/m.12053 type:complete len:87 (-) Transcript_9189:255-515(-)
MPKCLQSSESKKAKINAILGANSTCNKYRIFPELVLKILYQNFEIPNFPLEIYEPPPLVSRILSAKSIKKAKKMYSVVLVVGICCL